MEDKLFTARLEDMLKGVSNGQIKFLGFLSESEAAQADIYLSHSGEKYVFFGGYEMAQRRYLCVCPDWCEPQFPVTALTFSFRNAATLAHRDFLGALMSVGITRQSVGDILIENGRAVVFVSSDIAPFVVSQINKVANEGVTISKGFCEPLPEISKKQSFSDTVASDRIDCIVAAICNLSRAKAAEMINDGFVSINSKTVCKPTVKVSAGDKISVRKKGRFEIVSASDLSKKNRIILKYNKYV